MKNIILSMLLSATATAAYADDYWSGFLDINTSFQRDNYYDGSNIKVLQDDQWHRTAAAEVQYRWNACAIGARANFSVVSYDTSSAITGAETERDTEGYGIGAQAGCNLHGLWLVGFGSVQKTDWDWISSVTEITDYRDRTYGAGLYFQHLERMGYGIAVSRLNTQYTATFYDPYWGFAYPLKYEIDTNIVEGKLDYFITQNLLSSTTISYSKNDNSGSSSFFTRLEFKPESMNFAAYAGIGASIARADDTDDEIKSYTAKVGLRWYFAKDTLQTMHNNQMPTFD
jgi:hypothetical protein